MECNSEIYSSIKGLAREQKIQFGLSSIHRVIGLYKLFENADNSQSIEAIIPQGERYNTLISIVEYLQNNRGYDNNEIKRYIDLLESLTTDDEDDGSSIGLAITGYIVTGIIAILEFIENDDDERIFWCSDSIIEILNQINFEKYYSKYPDYSDDEIEKLVDASLDDEIKIQKEIISMIKNNIESEKLEQYITKNLIQK